MDQNERLELLVERFKEESVRYRNIPSGDTAEEKRVTLRSLMNIRPPRAIDEGTLRIQDEYLREWIEEDGVTALSDIPTLREEFHTDKPFSDVLSVWQGDITHLAVGAIVNAANSAMLGCFQPMHTCIDNCIHTLAGVQLRLECDRQMAQLRRRFGEDYMQPTSVPMLTPGYNLPAQYVIHIVGPIVDVHLTPAHEKALADCYTNTLDMCRENGITTVALCSISTGVFRFPPERAAEIAAHTVKRWLKAHDGAMERVIFNVHRPQQRQYYENVLL